MNKNTKVNEKNIHGENKEKEEEEESEEDGEISDESKDSFLQIKKDNIASEIVQGVDDMSIISKSDIINNINNIVDFSSLEKESLLDSSLNHSYYPNQYLQIKNNKYNNLNEINHIQNIQNHPNETNESKDLDFLILKYIDEKGWVIYSDDSEFLGDFNSLEVFSFFSGKIIKNIDINKFFVSDKNNKLKLAGSVAFINLFHKLKKCLQIVKDFWLKQMEPNNSNLYKNSNNNSIINYDNLNIKDKNNSNNYAPNDLYNYLSKTKEQNEQNSLKVNNNDENKKLYMLILKSMNIKNWVVFNKSGIKINSYNSNELFQFLSEKIVQNINLRDFIILTREEKIKFTGDILFVSLYNNLPIIFKSAKELYNQIFSDI